MIRWYYAVTCHPNRCFKFTGTSKSGAARYNHFPRSGAAQPRGDLFKFYEILKSPSHFSQVMTWTIQTRKCQTYFRNTMTRTTVCRSCPTCRIALTFDDMSSVVTVSALAPAFSAIKTVVIILMQKNICVLSYLSYLPAY